MEETNLNTVYTEKNVPNSFERSAVLPASFFSCCNKFQTCLFPEKTHSYVAAFITSFWPLSPCFIFFTFFHVFLACFFLFFLFFFYVLFNVFSTQFTRFFTHKKCF